VDKQVLIIEMPELNDAAVAQLHDFLQELTNAFEVHYFHSLQRYDRKSSLDDNIEDIL
jgi:hypothetical protein